MKQDINNYPGSKNGSGVPQWIISHIPRYTKYYELFAGSSVIARTLYAAVGGKNRHEVVERSENVCEQLMAVYKFAEQIKVTRADGIEVLKNLIGSGCSSIFVYLDPPYRKESRSNPTDIYEYEWIERQHVEFLNLVLLAKFPVMISHYPDPLYDQILKGWKTSTMQVRTRRHTAVEKIYMNYDIEEMELATTKFVGKSYGDRQRINRRKKAYAEKFLKMPAYESQAILEHIQKQLKQSK